MGCGCKDKTDPYAEVRAERDRWLRNKVRGTDRMAIHAIRFERDDITVYVVIEAKSAEDAAEFAVKELADGNFDLVGAENQVVSAGEVAASAP